MLGCSVVGEGLDLGLLRPQAPTSKEREREIAIETMYGVVKYSSGRSGMAGAL